MIIVNVIGLLETALDSESSNDKAWEAFKKIKADPTNLDYICKILMIKFSSKAGKLLTLAFDKAAPEGEARSSFMRIRTIFVRSKMRVRSTMEAATAQGISMRKDDLSKVFRPGTEYEVIQIIQSMEGDRGRRDRNVWDHWSVKLPDGRTVKQCMEDDPEYILLMSRNFDILTGNADRMSAVMWAADVVKGRKQSVSGR